MLQTIISILGILITILFVVGTHESAHFFMARLVGVKVLRFSIGFGKALFRFHDRSGTEYVFAWLPLGGYVKMLDESEGDVPADEKQYSYNQQPFYKKCLIVLAGPAMNIFCAFVLYWIVFMMGFTSIKPVIGGVTPDSIAAAAKVSTHQEIVRVDDQPVQSWLGVVFRLLTHAGDQDHVKLTTTDLHHPKQEHQYSLDLHTWQMNDRTPDPLSSIGITPAQPASLDSPLLKKVQYDALGALKPAYHQIRDFTYFNGILIIKLITGKLSLQSMGGPITIFQTAGDSLYYGLLSFLSFLAFLSISIGIINLLPIPGLDGGHLFFQLIEFIIRRPLPERLLRVLYAGGFALLIFVITQALVNDIIRLL